MPELQTSFDQSLATNAVIAPGLKMPGRKIYWCGESYIKNGESTANNTTVQTDSIPNMVHFFLNKRLSYNPSQNYAVGGTVSDQIVQQAFAALKNSPDILVVSMGSNDLTQATGTANQDGTTYNRIVSNMLTVLNAAAAQNVLVLVLPILPRNTTANNFVDNALRYNTWLRLVASVRQGVVYVDTVTPFVDAAQTTFYRPLTTLTKADVIHPNQAGAITIAKQIAGALLEAIPTINDDLPYSALDAWSAYNPYGNLLSNGIFTGSGGTISDVAGANTTTGTVATGWTVSNRNGTGATGAGNITVTCSKPTHPLIPSMVGQRVVLSGTGGQGTSGTAGVWVFADVTPSGGNVTAGQTQIDIAGELILTGVQGLNRIYFNLLSHNGTTYDTGISTFWQADSETTALPANYSAWGTVQLPRFTIPSNMSSTGLRLRVEIFSTTSAALGGTIDFFRFAARRAS